VAVAAVPPVNPLLQDMDLSSTWGLTLWTALTCITGQLHSTVSAPWVRLLFRSMLQAEYSAASFLVVDYFAACVWGVEICI